MMGEWRPDFAPLEKYLARHSEHLRLLPWEYMGHDVAGDVHYRERERGNRVVVRVKKSNNNLV